MTKVIYEQYIYFKINILIINMTICNKLLIEYVYVLHTHCLMLFQTSFSSLVYLSLFARGRCFPLVLHLLTYENMI